MCLYQLFPTVSTKCITLNTDSTVLSLVEKMVLLITLPPLLPYLHLTWFVVHFFPLQGKLLSAVLTKEKKK